MSKVRIDMVALEKKTMTKKSWLEMQKANRVCFKGNLETVTHKSEKDYKRCKRVDLRKVDLD